MTGYESKRAAAQDKLDSMERKALKLALEALENSVDLVREDAYNAEKLYGNYPSRQGKVGGLKVLADDHEKAITALKERLAQPAQEPRLEQGPDYERGFVDGMQKQMQSSVDKAVNRMAQRPWVGLTDEDIALIDWESLVTRKDCVRAIEAKLKEKNNG